MINVVQLEQTCTACPSQWEGKTDDDRSVYVRYRWGYLSVRVSAPGTDIWAAVDGEEVFGAQIADDHHGTMTIGELISLTRNVACWPNA